MRLEKQNVVGHIVLDRPPANSYDKAFLDEFSTAIDEARFDRDGQGDRHPQRAGALLLRGAHTVIAARHG